MVKRRTEQLRDFYLNAVASGRGKISPAFNNSIAVVPSSGIPSAPAASATPAPLEPAVKSRLIADFKEEARDVLSRVSSSTASFAEINSFDAVKKFPPLVVESVDKLTSRGRDFRSKLGYEAALHECGKETATVDALQVLNEVNQSIAAGDALAAGSQVSTFLQTNPEPTADEQKPLWNYLKSVRLLCGRQEKDAETHLQRGQSFLSAGKTSDAVREYQEAYRIYPNPQTATKIKEIQDSSLGL